VSKKRLSAMHLVDAPNVMTPAYLTILSKGYSVTQSGDLMVAEREGSSFAAVSPVALLGLITMIEARGERWQATACEIDEFVALFG
jgi:hypothetical protein